MRKEDNANVNVNVEEEEKILQCYKDDGLILWWPDRYPAGAAAKQPASRSRQDQEVVVVVV